MQNNTKRDDNNKALPSYAAASAFFGVAAFFGGVFLGAAAFFGAAAFLADVSALVLVTRPDLVLVRTLGTSTTAGACREKNVSNRVSKTCSVSRGVRTAVDGLVAFFALGLAVLALGLAVTAFFAAGVFFVVVLLAAVFFGAAFLAPVVGAVVAPVDGAAFGLASFWIMINDVQGVGRIERQTFGLASFLASFTGPDGPVVIRVSQMEVKLAPGWKSVCLDSRTLRLCEITLLNTILESFVEHGIELYVRGE
jgi:hypothetical protein